MTTTKTVVKMCNLSSHMALRLSSILKITEILLVRSSFSLRVYGGSDPADSDNDIDKLLEKTEKEAVKEAPKGAGGLSFAFAKIWAAEKDSLEEVVEEDQTDSWAQTLQKINTEREKEQEKNIAESGRGARRKAADIAKVVSSGTFSAKALMRSRLRFMWVPEVRKFLISQRSQRGTKTRRIPEALMGQLILALRIR